MFVYIGFKVGLTRSGPQKSVSVNIVLEESEEDDITDVIQPVGAVSLPEEEPLQLYSLTKKGKG